MTRDEQIDALLAAIEVAGDVIRFKPAGHQRMALSPTGLSISDDDPDPRWYAAGNCYISGRLGVQTAVEWHSAPGRPDLSQTGAGGFPASFSVQSSNLQDSVAVQVWGGDKVPDDGQDAIAVFVSSADAHRPHSRNVALRLDAINYNLDGSGTVSAVDAREVGANTVPETTIPDKLDYPGDTWALAAFSQFQAINPFTCAIWHSRMMFDIGANSDKRPAGDYQYYFDKHKAEIPR